ncbi:hypothetical protein DH2020_038544 [Rehmannia glutinosa]|uniref:Uncharacterized protein n=1 Tax=Rehmannia glutinosa TaxID=99300 RepID=A0ABR0UY87_REHGL
MGTAPRAARVSNNSSMNNTTPTANRAARGRPAPSSFETRVLHSNYTIFQIKEQRFLTRDSEEDPKVEPSSQKTMLPSSPSRSIHVYISLSSSTFQLGHDLRFLCSSEDMRKEHFSCQKWTLKQLQYKDENTPKCTQNHTTHPAILFSIGGFSGNYFHDFADVLFPLFSTSFHFRKEARFLISDYKPWWVNKFRQILDHLTKHDLVDIDGEKLHTHCYSKIIGGLKFYRELIADPSLSKSAMQSFRRELRRVYALERKTAIRDGAIRPRLMIVSRNRTRILTNVDDVSRLATTLGYEVVIAEAGVSTNVTRFAQTVNSCDVFDGNTWRGLTNMVFLPDNAVLIQVVPFGGIDGFARLDFGNPSDGMNIRYLEYKITVNESSLSQQYSSDDPILKHPESYKGWNAVQSIYLDKQNVTIALDRFKGTLAKALKLIRH